MLVGGGPTARGASVTAVGPRDCPWGLRDCPWGLLLRSGASGAGLSLRVPFTLPNFSTFTGPLADLLLVFEDFFF